MVSALVLLSLVVVVASLGVNGSFVIVVLWVSASACGESLVSLSCSVDCMVFGMEWLLCLLMLFWCVRVFRNSGLLLLSSYSSPWWVVGMWLLISILVFLRLSGFSAMRMVVLGCMIWVSEVGVCCGWSVSTSSSGAHGGWCRRCVMSLSDVVLY